MLPPLFPALHVAFGLSSTSGRSAFLRDPEASAWMEADSRPPPDDPRENEKQKCGHEICRYNINAISVARSGLRGTGDTASIVLNKPKITQGWRTVLRDIPSAKGRDNA